MRGIERQLGRVYEEKGFYYLEKIYDDLDDLMLEEKTFALTEYAEKFEKKTIIID